MTLAWGIAVLVLLAGVIAAVVRWERQFPSSWAGYQFDPGDNLPSDLADGLGTIHDREVADA